MEHTMEIRDDQENQFTRRGFMGCIGAGAFAAGVVAATAQGETAAVETAALPETLPMPGWEMQLLVDSKGTDGRCSILVETTPPGLGPPMHSHGNEEEYFYIIEGEYEFIVGDETLRPDAGTFLAVPRGVAHRFQNVGAEPGVLHITLSPAGFEEFFRKVSAHVRAGQPDPVIIRALGEEHGLTWHD